MSGREWECRSVQGCRRSSPQAVWTGTGVKDFDLGSAGGKKVSQTSPFLPLDPLAMLDGCLVLHPKADGVACRWLRLAASVSCWPPQMGRSRL